MQALKCIDKCLSWLWNTFCRLMVCGHLKVFDLLKWWIWYFQMLEDREWLGYHRRMQPWARGLLTLPMLASTVCVCVSVCEREAGHWEVLWVKKALYKCHPLSLCLILSLSLWAHIFTSSLAFNIYCYWYLRSEQPDCKSLTLLH